MKEITKKMWQNLRAKKVTELDKVTKRNDPDDQYYIECYSNSIKDINKIIASKEEA